MRNTLSRYRNILVCVILAGVTVGVYWQVLYNDFVNYDDPVYVTENKHLKEGLTWQGVVWAFTSERADNWHPVTWLSLMLDYEVFGLDARGFHITNLVIHIVNTLLLFLFLREVTGAFWRSGFVASVFALHPLHVESVAWVAERKDVLSAMFWFLTMLAYVSYVRRGGVVRYAGLLLLFAFGLMAKPMLVTLPFVLLLLDYWPLSRLRVERLSGSDVEKGEGLLKLFLEKVPLFVLAGVSSAITLIVQQRGGAVIALEKLVFGKRVVNALVSYLMYIVKTFLPTRLGVYYPYTGELPVWQVIGVVFLLVLVSVSVVFFRRRYLVFGWFWYVGTLVPVAGFVQVGSQARADRYMYIPMTGLLVMVGWGVCELVGRRGWRRVFAAFVSGVWILVLIVFTWFQVGYWQNSYTLLTHTVSVTNDNFIAYLNLGNYFAKERKEAGEAIGYYRKAIQIHRKYVDAHYNLGIALGLEKRYDEAIEAYKRVLRLREEHWRARLRLADTLVKKGRLEEAIEQYSRVVEIKPRHAEVHNNFGLALVRKGDIDEAIRHYERSLDIRPDSVEVLNNLGNALVKQKRFEEAVLYLKKALSLDASFFKTYYNLGNALQQMGRIDEAAEYYREAVHLRPDDADAHYRFGLVLDRPEEYDEAVEHYQRAIKLKPDFAEAHYQVGVLYAERNELDKAIEEFREVLRIYPDDADMHCNVGVLLSQRGSIDEAIEEFRTALRLNPAFSKAREQLEAALARRAAGE
ncbi:MAG: tetratricopeptide repeat protein [Planctomycetota bacterium]|nr:MAG: tetratricopeptide repeat protein [Planctomycetota bacterium]